MSCLAALAAAVWLLAPAAAAAADGPTLAPFGTPAFPERSFILSVPPGHALDPDAIHVRENGRIVPDVRMSGASSGAADTLGITLVIDSSVSMRGKPIVAAMQAAQALAARRAPQQPLSVVTYDRRPRVLLPPTTDAATIARALSERPALRPGTQIHDGVLAAVDAMRGAGIESGSIVLLSDGVCRLGGRSTCRRGDAAAGEHTLEEAVQAARSANLRLFTVGLRGRYYDDGQLREMADRAGGEFLEARSTADLAGIYAQLGARLANEYVIRYRSAAAPGPVHVSLRVRDIAGIATSRYTAPSAGVAPAPRSAETFWGSNLALVLTSVLVAAIIGVAVAFMLGRGASGRRVRRSVGEFVVTEEPSSSARGEEGAPARRSVVSAAVERMFARRAWWDVLKSNLEIGRVEMPAERVVIITVALTLVVAWLLGSVAPPLAVLALFVPVAARWRIRRAATAQRTLFDDQLADALQGTASALRAGYSLIGALTVISQDAPEPLRAEFQRVISDERLGVALEDGLREMAMRMENGDVEQIAMVAVLQHETGGNIAEVVDSVTDVVRERNDLRRAVRALTAQGRMARTILTALPIGLLIVSSLLNYEYVAPLFEESLGLVLLAVGGVMVALGSLAIKKIVEVEV